MRIIHTLALLLVCLLIGCSDDATTGPQTPLTPAGGTATLVVRHVLLRAVPANVTRFRFSGQDAAGNLVFGPEVRGKAAEITLTVPVSMTSLRIEYLQADGTVVGLFIQEVSLQPGQTLTIEDPDFQDASGVPFQLAFSPPPANGTVGSNLPGVEVVVQDANGNQVSSASNSVTLSLAVNPGNATLSGTTTVGAVDGIAFFGDLILNAPGSGYRFGATSPGLTPATSDPFDVTGGVTGGATQLVFANPVPDGVTLTNLIGVAVQIRDANNNLVTTANNPVTIALGTNPGNGTLMGTTTVNAVAGVATFSDLQIDRPGSGWVLQATSNNLAQATSSNFRLRMTLSFASTAFTLNGGQGATTDPSSVTVGDFDNDGNQDFAVADGSAMNNPRLSVFLGNGDGTFQAEALFNTNSTFTRGCAAGDFNQDGLSDLAVINASNVEMLLSVNGTFPAVTTSNNNVGTSLRGICTGEFSGDNLPDIAVSDPGDDSITILVNNGNNTFTATNYPSGGALSNCRGIAAGDYSGDGRDDVVVANFGGGQGTTVWRNSTTAGALFPAANALVLPASSATATAQATTFGDFNNDGLLDVGTSFIDGNNARARTYVNNGDNTFDVGSTEFLSQDPFGAGSGDFDLDGFVDFLAGSAFGLNFVNPGEAIILRGRGDGTLEPQQPFKVNPGGVVRAVTRTDFNNDGKLDVVTAGDTAHVLINTSN